MFYAHCKTYFLYLCIGLINLSAFANQKPENIERLKIMNNQKDQKPLSWISFINETVTSKSGIFTAKNNLGKPILLEWSKIDPKSLEFNEKIKSSSSILIETFTKQEIEFAKKHPEAVPHEHFLKPLEVLFKEGLENVNWDLAEKQLKSIFEEFFTATDLTKYASSEEIQFFVIAKDKETNEILGFIQFIITSQDQYGSIKAGMVSINSKALNTGLEILLLSSIFKFVPDISRIYLHTRTTNEPALNAYKNLGFTKYSGPLAYWQDMEYLADKSNILQKS